MTRNISTPWDLRAEVKNGGHAWPGGYPIVLVCADGEMASVAALARKENRDALRRAMADIQYRANERPMYAWVYFEGPDAVCAYTGEIIESAYGDPDAPENIENGLEGI